MTTEALTIPEIELTVSEAINGLRAVAARHPDTEEATEAVASLLLRLDTMLDEVRMLAALGRPASDIAEAVGKRGARHRVKVGR